MELNQLFTDLWKKIKVATNETKKNVMIIIGKLSKPKLGQRGG